MYHSVHSNCWLAPVLYARGLDIRAICGVMRGKTRKVSYNALEAILEGGINILIYL